MNVLITIFILPHEIDDLVNTIGKLNSSLKYLKNSNNEYSLDVTMSVSNELIDWKNSKLGKDYFVEYFAKIEKIVDSKFKKTFRVSDTINGVVSARRLTSKLNDIDYHIWIDTDLLFDERTLAYMEYSINELHHTNNLIIITPEVVKLWDNTWDCIVADKFSGENYGYEKRHNPFDDSTIHDEVSINTVVNNINGQPIYKFGGGWFTCISSDLLKLCGIPSSFGHYGPDDTFIMHASELLRTKKNMDIQQFKLKNLVVCENFNRVNPYKDKLVLHNRKDEYRKLAELNFNDELEKLMLT